MEGSVAWLQTPAAAQQTAEHLAPGLSADTYLYNYLIPRARAVFPLPMRSPKAKAIKKPSKGKIKNELRNKITNYFQLQDVKTSQELESRNSLSLSESADQSVVAGVRPKSEADSSSSE